MKITFLETSDMHGYVAPTNFSDDQEQGFGTAKVAAKMKQLKAEANGPVITIENGDFIQGSPLSYYIAKSQHPVAALTAPVNQLGVDAHVLGNHEFNYGLDYLKEAISSYQSPVLAANIVNDTGEPFFGQAYTIIEKEGVKIAVLGLVTQYIPHWEQPATIKGMTFQSIVDTAKVYVPKLRELADIVVISYHGGFEKDLTTGEPTELLTGENEGYQLLHEVSGIDALFTGHQHREIAGVVNGVPVVQPGFRGSFIGKIELTVTTDEGRVRVVEREAALVPVADAAPDEATLALLAPINEELNTWLDQPLGQVQGDMRITDPMGARIKEHPYIEFINQVQMAASGAKISGTALFNNEGKGFGSTITMRDVITNYIYPNTLAVVRVTGAELKAALEQTANYLVSEAGQIIFNPAFIDPKPQYYNYDMYEGIEYTIDLRQPTGQRITALAFEGAAIGMEQPLDIVINQYRAVGGGNYDMFSADKIIREIQVDMTELIADYLKAHPMIEAATNQNFTVIA
ncbi:bifunctional metallophosphatase/5'-nucleotidase [Enterococcus sp. N249-2]